MNTSLDVKYVVEKVREQRCVCVCGGGRGGGVECVPGRFIVHIVVRLEKNICSKIKPGASF